MTYIKIIVNDLQMKEIFRRYYIRGEEVVYWVINEKEIIKINIDNFDTLFPGPFTFTQKSFTQILLEIGAHPRSKVMVV